MQGLRGIGALGIVAYHMYALEGYAGSDVLLDRTIGMGGVYVQLFFMISSFSLMCGYADKIWKNEQDISLFYENRVLKLLPTFYFALMIHLLLNFLLGIATAWEDVAGTASLLYGLMPSHQESIVMAGWALGIEVVFYLIFPAFLVAVKTKKTCLLSFAVSIILYIAYDSYYAVGIETYYINIVRQLVPFVCGALLYHCLPRLESMSSLARKRLGIGCQILLILIFIFWAADILYGTVIVWFTFILVMLNQLYYKDILINNKLFRWFGKLSYEIYLFHMLIYRGLYYVHYQAFLETYIPVRQLQYLCLLLSELLLTVGLSWGFTQIRKKICKACSQP